jgi:hypothetical protein
MRWPESPCHSAFPAAAPAPRSRPPPPSRTPPGSPDSIAATAAGAPGSAIFALTNTATGGPGTSASFLGADNTTKGNWKSVYGSEGYFIPNLATSYPSYATVVRTGSAYTWDPNPSGAESDRALERVTPPGRIASAVIGEVSFTFDINLTDGQAHRVAFYMTDYLSTTTIQTVTVIDQATNAVLDTQNVSSFRSGRWLVYSLRGRVIVRVTKTGGSWAQINGIFFGP